MATYILGVIGDAKNLDDNPELLGRILGAGVLISYLGCIPFFLCNAEYYAQRVKA
jgi:hypothetical protein